MSRIGLQLPIQPTILRTRKDLRLSELRLELLLISRHHFGWKPFTDTQVALREAPTAGSAR